ncbi:MAG TPA: DUF5069 domain-containing protein [Candidatus Baltobacteraceae bacterium]|nr:DUF5069 domain-containing protein [Candidatus Baltobacteraceae bacterium]
MDLTKEFPRSVRDKTHGLVQIGRTLDKANAVAHGNVGDYHYNCGMDQAVFTFLGIDHEALLEVVKTKTPAEVDAYVKSFIDKKSAEEIARWNQEWLTKAPTGESLEFFLKTRNSIAPTRADVMSWPDLLDLDEKRSVPIRETANA